MLNVRFTGFVPCTKKNPKATTTTTNNTDKKVISKETAIPKTKRALFAGDDIYRLCPLH